MLNVTTVIQIILFQIALVQLFSMTIFDSKFSILKVLGRKQYFRLVRFYWLSIASCVDTRTGTN